MFYVQHHQALNTKTRSYPYRKQWYKSVSKLIATLLLLGLRNVVDEHWGFALRYRLTIQWYVDFWPPATERRSVHSYSPCMGSVKILAKTQFCTISCGTYFGGARAQSANDCEALAADPFFTLYFPSLWTGRNERYIVHQKQICYAKHKIWLKDTEYANRPRRLSFVHSVLTSFFRAFRTDKSCLKLWSALAYSHQQACTDSLLC